MGFFRGSVCVRLKGAVSAAKITQIAQSVPLKSVRRERDGVSMQLSLGDVLRLRQLLKGQKIRMRVVRRMGLPFVRVWLRRGAPFWAAVMAALLLLVSFSQTVLDVRVTGTQDASLIQSLQGELLEMGVRRGMLVGELDKKGVETALRSAHPDLSYLALKRQGVRLELFVVEATEKPELFDPDAPVDVVAGSAGLITGVTVFSGTPLVRPGDTVRQGQVLIRGVDDSGNICHASGQITARLWHRGAGVAELYEERRERTGRRISDTRLTVLNFDLSLFQRENPFADFDVSHQKGILLDGLFFPILWDRINIYEVNALFVPRDFDLVSRQAAQRALTDALKLIPNGGRVVDKRLEYSKIGDEKLLASLVLESQAEIGVQTGSAEIVWEE